MNLDQLLNDAFGVENNGDLAKIMQDVVAKRVQERSEAVKSRLGQILQHGDNNVENMVKSLRLLRQQEASTAKKLKQISRALEYFKFSGNPLPYLKSAPGTQPFITCFFRDLGLDAADYPPETHEYFKIPDDFQPAK